MLHPLLRAPASFTPAASTSASSGSPPSGSPPSARTARAAVWEGTAGRRLGATFDAQPASAAARTSSQVAVRSRNSRAPGPIQRIATRAEFDALFRSGASVTAGSPSELKFLIDRKTGAIHFLPPEVPFHFAYYKQVLRGPLDNAGFNARAYNRPDRDFIAGTLTAYDSYVDPRTGKQGQLCFSLWPTDRFDAGLLKETRDAVVGALDFLTPSDAVAFRPGGPLQDRLVASERRALRSAKVPVKTNVQISKGLRFMALSKGKAVGNLVVIEKGAAVPVLSRRDIAVFLGDVPPEAPPVAAIFTTTVQTYNSHLGIKYRQEDTPFFYKAFTEAEIAGLRALAGTPVEVVTTAKDAVVKPATAAQARAYIRKIKPKGRVRLTPNLSENRARTFADLARRTVGRDGRWNEATLAAYGRKTAGIVELAKLKAAGALNVGGAAAPEVIAPEKPMGIPANWYRRFMQGAHDEHGVLFKDRLKAMTSDRKFRDPAWRAEALASMRDAIEDAALPADLLQDLREQVAVPYMKEHPGLRRARLRSSSPAVEDGGVGGKLPNMAGAFDSNTARWDEGSTAKETLDNCVRAMAEALLEDYASVFSDRAVATLDWHNVDMDEESVTMAVLVTPNEDDEIANGVLKVNRDLAGFFSITGETQFGEQLVTNPEGGAIPDTWVDGNYDVLNGAPKQSIAYERLSNRRPRGVRRRHAFTDDEIRACYDTMQVLRDHFATLHGLAPEAYINECEVKITEDGKVLFKQERPWVE